MPETEPFILRGFMTQMHSTQSLSVGIVIVAAGRGERAGSPEEGPKQYRTIGGRPVIAHTLERFVTWPQTTKIVVVIHRDDESLLRSALAQVSGLPKVEIAFGGTTRQQSVLAGLRQLAASDVTHVMIHDAVRPF